LKPIHQGALRFAASSNGPGNKTLARPGNVYNGKLDAVRIASTALDKGQIRVLSGNTVPSGLKKQVKGFWDFSRDIGSTRVSDISGNNLHGHTVNLPMRAVTGVRWSGDKWDWRDAPGQYGAIYFHDDDLYDAEWKSDFSYRIPANLKSGVYAVRLKHGKSEDYIPFYVAPPKGKALAKVAFMIDTATYRAYANNALHYLQGDRFKTMAITAADVRFQKRHHHTLGKGIYRMHTDGSHVVFASSLHPNITVKPKGHSWALNPDTHLIDWLETLGIDYDVITDDFLHSDGVDLLKDYTVVMTGTHPEYQTKEMMRAIEQYMDQGGRWMYLGGNGYQKVVSYSKELPEVLELRKQRSFYPQAINGERYHEFDGTRFDNTEKNHARPEKMFGVGTTRIGFLRHVPYLRRPESNDPRARFIFDGVEDQIIGDFGYHGGAAVGEETNFADYEQGTPEHALILARGESSYSPEGKRDKSDIKAEGNLIADMVFFETPNGGAVFSVGSMSWITSLLWNNTDNNVSRITENVVRRFMDPAPFQ